MLSVEKASQIPDEELSYSALRDRIRKEVSDALPTKVRLMLLASKLESEGILKDTVCQRICTDYKGIIAPQYIRRSLPDEYKQQKKKREKSSDRLRNRGSANDNKEVLEQRLAVTSAHRNNTANTEPVTNDYLKEENLRLKERTRYMSRQIEELKKSNK